MHGAVHPAEGAAWSSERGCLEISRTPLVPTAQPLRVLAHFALDGGGDGGGDGGSAPAGADGGAGVADVHAKPAPARPLIARFAAAGATASGLDIEVIELARADAHAGAGAGEAPSADASAGAPRCVSRVLRRFVSGRYEVHAEEAPAVPGGAPSRREAGPGGAAQQTTAP